MADEKTPTNPYVLRNTTMFVDGVEHGHGDTVDLDPNRGDNLTEQGLVVPKGEWEKVKAADERGHGDDKAQRQALEDARVIEESKARGLQATNEERIAPAGPRRGRPPRS